MSTAFMAPTEDIVMSITTVAVVAAAPNTTAAAAPPVGAVIAAVPSLVRVICGVLAGLWWGYLGPFRRRGSDRDNGNTDDLRRRIFEVWIRRAAMRRRRVRVTNHWVWI